MFTNINKHGSTILTGMELMGLGFTAGSKTMVNGMSTIILTGGVGALAVVDGVSHILYDGMMALPKVAVCR